MLQKSGKDIRCVCYFTVGYATIAAKRLLYAHLPALRAGA